MSPGQFQHLFCHWDLNGILCEDFQDFALLPLNRSQGLGLIKQIPSTTSILATFPKLTIHSMLNNRLPATVQDNTIKGLSYQKIHRIRS